MWVVTNRHLAGEASFLQVLESALQGKPDVLVLREKDLSPRHLFELASQVKALTAKTGTAFFVNGSVEVALAVEADGVHLGMGALAPSVARRLLRPQQWLGLSVHSWNEVAALSKQDQAALDYLMLGNLFETDCKAGKKGLGLELLRDFTTLSPWPVVAIGGISAENGTMALRQGAASVAVMSAVMASPEPARTVQQLRKAFSS
ncbi:thiamine-phosphate pyrophosphorylase [Heliorestis convoluta]|uniref:Thiamine-phosphate synthase n=1 Tax=Heliorestis convoluta TaxID=356322 RepID=A0A5Q2N3I7_9FIRM|nr:thiamine-phosphate pyrophosphorylase [Heliorestis convoluta]